MTGFLSDHGTSPCLFQGKFLDFSIIEDDEIHVGRTNVLDFPYTSFPIESIEDEVEPFDHNFEETFWSSLMLGADYDWDDQPGEDIVDWVQRRYADVIHLNNEIGYRRPTAEIISFTIAYAGRSRTNVRDHHWSERRELKRWNPNRDHLRGKAHAK
ncbi:MAG: hypothetical protein KBC62_00170 [Candidatus Pacebacteria bacterium]|nr:hypothetical protein [Candidatus Paceibacterota bacterium]MBP9842402.1 hypothetical protein [Candidatus Paceibacterota bacterium]